MISNFLRLLVLGAALPCLLAACSDSFDSSPVFHPDQNPQRLSEWNLFTLSGNALVPSAASLVFRPANQLFTDYAQKLRTLWIPEGSQAKLIDNEIGYPVGTVLSKTFYYPMDADGALLKRGDASEQSVNLVSSKLIETRLLVRRETGWDAFPYVWNEDATEAFLRVAGTSTPISLKNDPGNLDFVYFVPNENQCAGCHVTSHPDGGLHPLGAIASQLHWKNWGFPIDDVEIQTEILVARGWLDQAPDIPDPVLWRDKNADIEERALAYLNIHCGHCHNPEGAADTSSLILDGSHSLMLNMGVCKTPVAAGGGSGDRLYSIVPGDPERSILLYRMQSVEPDEMMPELGRSLVHSEGIELISDWISQLPGICL